MKNKWRIFLTAGWIPTLILVGGARWLAPGSFEAQERTPIKITRIYTGADGQTHAEEYQVPLARRGRSATELAEPIPVTSVQFRRTSPDYYLDFHNAPAAPVRHHAEGRKRG